jgi:hypothetical protein
MSTEEGIQETLFRACFNEIKNVTDLFHDAIMMQSAAILRRYFTRNNEEGILPEAGR